MGWFAIAVVLGALLRWGWREYAPVDADAQRRIVIAGLAVAGFVLVLRSVYLEQSLSPIAIIDAIAHGQVARFVLGMTLGFVIAHGLFWGLVTGLNFLWLALAITALAMVAPHMDVWLSRATSFKAGSIEIALANQARANHKFAVADNMESFARNTVFILFRQYPENIQLDIDYYRHIELAELNLKDVKDPSRSLAKLKELEEYLVSAQQIQRVFANLISPLAACFSNSIGRSLSFEHLRDIMRPHSDNLRRIIFDQKDQGSAAEDRHTRFWDGLLRAADDVDAQSGGVGKCWQATIGYKIDNPFRFNKAAYPRIYEHKALPHLYVAAALLMFFANETEVAWRILEEFRSDVRFQDYHFLSLISRFSYYLGRPTIELIYPLEEIRRSTVERQQRLVRHCDISPCDERKRAMINRMKRRERMNEIMFLNLMTYLAAEEIARGAISARGLEKRVRDLVNALKAIVDDNRDQLDPDWIYDIRDTYAYALVVVEAQNPAPNTLLFREMEWVLREVVHYFEQKLTAAIRRGEVPTRADHTALNIMRKHHQSAQELARE